MADFLVYGIADHGDVRQERILLHGNWASMRKSLMVWLVLCGALIGMCALALDVLGFLPRL